MAVDLYILGENRNIIPCPNLFEWSAWLETSGDLRQVKLDMFAWGRVSTVFLGINHQWGEGPPILWETMVFGGPLDRKQDRCAGGIEQAEAMHEAMLARVLLTV